MCRHKEKSMKLFWTNNIYRQLLLNSCFSSFGDSIFYLAIINYVAQYNFAPLAILLISISEMVPLLSQLFLGILGDFQENRVKHALWIAKIKILLYAILTVFLVLSPFSLVSVIMIVIINLIQPSLQYHQNSKFYRLFYANRLLYDHLLHNIFYYPYQQIGHLWYSQIPYL